MNPTSTLSKPKLTSTSSNSLSPAIGREQILARDPHVRQQLGKLQNVEDNLGRSNFVRFRFQVLRTGLAILASDLLTCTICFGWAGLLTNVSLLATDPLVVSGLLSALVATFLAIGLYSTRGLSPICEFRLVAVGCVTLGVPILTLANQHPNFPTLLLSMGLIFVLLPVSRAISRRLFASCNWWGLKCIVFDCDRRVGGLYSGHLDAIPTGFRPIGFIQDSLPDGLETEIREQYLGGYEQANHKMNEKDAYVALIHRRGRADHEIIKFINQKLRFFSKTIVVPDDNRLPALWSLDSSGGIVMEDRLLCISSQLLKRTLDVTISLLLLTLTAPLLLVTSLLIAGKFGGSILIGQEREGQYGRKFKLLRFRTRLEGQTKTNRLGAFLESTRLCDLPQLINVLRGQMSLVGPRPIAPEETELYTHKLQSYHRVKPGVTGFWQVSGKHDSQLDYRVELDNFYVRNWTLWFDFYILWRSIKSIAMRKSPGK